MQTWRPYTSCYPALLGLAGCAVGGGAGRPDALVVAALAPALGWLSGHYLGDYFDRCLDAIGKPHRPIPSGRLSTEAALYGGLACAALSAGLVVWANWRIVPLFAVAMAGIVGYSKVFKRRGIAGNITRGSLTALTLVIGAMVAAPLPPWPLLPVAVGFLLHDTASNLVGTVRDVDGDRAGGYRSVAVQRGARHAVRLALRLYAGGVALVALGTAWATADPVAQLALTTVAATTGVIAFAPLVRAGDVVGARAALRAHELLVAERLVLAAAVFAGAAGGRFAVALVLPVLLFSLLTQALMRARHEFPPAAVAAGGKDWG
ncbi:UbiA family prenyltransferase [Saccharopolyspora erythraea]|uniref:UbiA family prenyltransferase n=1 Tax=Saccharopolyspora erythraea TaxID=1836 RepID=UPI001BAC8D7A|nr:UbiA family prenyltransferase [Saccharopolyspora erythraea]QUH03717.1 UbiA family prenyltransferase [Saccharopolyspora erythraea]